MKSSHFIFTPTFVLACSLAHLAPLPYYQAVIALSPSIELSYLLFKVVVPSPDEVRHQALLAHPAHSPNAMQVVLRAPCEIELYHLYDGLLLDYMVNVHCVKSSRADVSADNHWQFSVLKQLERVLASLQA